MAKMHFATPAGLSTVDTNTSSTRLISRSKACSEFPISTDGLAQLERGLRYGQVRHN